MMMNLDVEGAFNRTWHCAILRSMLNKKVPAYIIHIVRSFLQNRIVRLTYGGNVVEDETPDSCPQGAVLSPLLFKFVQELVIDAFHRYQAELEQRVLMDEDPLVCDKLLVNFADDSTVVFAGRSRAELTQCASDFLSWLALDCRDIHLNFSVKKTTCMLF